MNTFTQCDEQTINPRIANLFYVHIMLMGGKVSTGLSRIPGHHVTNGQNLNCCTHVVEVELFNTVVDDVTGSCVIPEIHMEATQTESNTI